MHRNIKKASHFTGYKSEVLHIREVRVSIGHVTCYPEDLVGLLLVVHSCTNGSIGQNTTVVTC